MNKDIYNILGLYYHLVLSNQVLRRKWLSPIKWRSFYLLCNAFLVT